MLDLESAVSGYDETLPVVFPDSTINILIVGAGGTGSRVAIDVARIMYEARRSGMTVNAAICDGDIVEEKNVGRQMFVPADIGRSKAEVIAELVNSDYGIDMTAHTEYFSMEQFVRQRVRGSTVDIHNDDTFYWLHSLNKNTAYGFTSPDINIIVGCVDEKSTSDRPARWHMAEVCHHYKSIWWLDCGNDVLDGQVTFGNSGDIGAINTLFSTCTSLPSPARQMPGLLEPAAPKAEDVSCAELTARRDQGLMVNSMMAMVASQYLYKIVIDRRLAIMSTYATSDGMEMDSKRITSSNIEPYCSMLVDTAANLT